MSSIVCQGLQSSCLESRTLHLKLASQPSSFSRSLGLAYAEAKEVGDKWHYEETTKKIQNHVYSNAGLNGLSFSQILSDHPHTPKETPYFKPLAEHSSSTTTLSEKSLELCTETLGCETGTDLIENMVFAPSYEGGNPKKERVNPRDILGAKKSNSHKFPPPLTTISSSDSLRVKRHREGGRLIIEAVVTTSTHTCFQAERSDGRLRLSVLKDYTCITDSTTAVDEEKKEDNDNEDGGNGDSDGGVEEDDGEGTGDVNENSLEVEGKIGIRKLQSGSRCNKDGRGDQNLLNWEPFWVATS